ncbi:MAG: TonB-dependent receptor [Sphingomonadales bacterium]|nr:TonB-dependent receptor [Sphingomonadales bacterium]
MNASLASLKTSFLFSCAAVALLGCAGTAHADTTHADMAPVADAPAASGDIIVTAQRRDESIQDVPMTLQALSGESLSQFNIVTFDDLLKFTPNVTYGSNGPGAGAIFMRGLSAGFVGNQSSATIAPFPNVALYLDDQSMQFPARNADVYLADMERVEVLEGPQGTLFGGGAEAGAVRYITNKPKLNKWEVRADGMYGGTSHGAANSAFSAVINAPIIADTLAVRGVIYHERQGGYIDNIASTFTRSNIDGGNSYFNVHPTTGNICPNGLPSSNGLATGLCALPAAQQSNGGVYNNNAIAGADINPVTYQGARIAADWQITPDWNLLVSESLQDMDAQGSFAQEPVGLDFQPLGKLQTTIFTPSYNKDRYWNTAWTLNGKVGDFKVIYTGSYMVRHIEDQQDYTNYSRTAAGMYYQCTGGTTGWGSKTPVCYSPAGSWHDTVRNTHMSHEFRVTTPADKPLRAIAGAYYEDFKIYDIMDFNYKTIPTCSAALITQGVSCAGVVSAIPGSTANSPGTKGANTAFGEDTQRGYKQYAFFGSVDWDVLPNLTVTAGTRYYHYSEFEVGGQYQTYAGNCADVIVCAIPNTLPVMVSGVLVNPKGNVNIDANNDRVVYHGFKSRGVITWKPAEHTMVYGVFSQGFRPGGFNRATRLILPDPANPAQAQFVRPNGYAPDSLTNWELGLKTDLFDRKVQLNLSAYYMIWENTQLGFYNPAAGFGNTSFVTNGPTYHVKGLEAQIVARPTTGLTIQGSITYNDNKQVNSPCFISNVPGSSTLGKCITAQAKGGATVPVLNPFGTAGGITPFTPKVQADIRLRYDWKMKDLNWFTTLAAAYTGAMYSEPNTYPDGTAVSGVFGTTQYRYRQPGYALVDAAVGVSMEHWTAQVFVKNLGDSNASTFTSSPQFIKAEVPVRPRTFGVRVSVNY